MLGLYEVIAGSGSNMMEGWLNHVQGSMKLLELRGTEQLESKRGLELFTLIRMQIGELSADIQGIFKDGQDRAAEDPEPFIKRALYIDADLVSWSMSLSPPWRYNVIATPAHLQSKSDAYTCYYGDTYYMFNSVGFASGWNNYCQTRIVIQEIVRSLCMRSMGSVTADISQKTMALANTISIQMIGSICASVPYHFNSGEVGVGLAFRLLWPIFITANCGATTPEIRDWAMKTLDLIGNTTGIQKALMMSQAVKKGHTMALIPGT
ncbi:C6 zinc finger domain protein [Penicillium waksmanii]|uniref:C6 zinc finger domain protein n=1 Tax=Penicillium waksmanii TaxID=69791 RepID=UPI0025473EB0|nr:C6 zinc finger domain protein [Penicillium waksmanii]KAJ5988362.1 C6 zinc finger domain protein [Penicillium waksmanii]